SGRALAGGSGPFDVRRAGAVARLARDVDVAPGGAVGLRGEVERLLQPGRVAGGAHVVPVHPPARPVDEVAGRDAGVRVKRIPALTLGVPGDGEGLEAPAGEGDEVLLE